MLAFFSSLLFLLSAQAAHAAPDCLDSFYDLDPRAAAIGLFCKGEEAPSEARLVFCHRATLLQTGECNGMRTPVQCQWREAEARWECLEAGEYKFTAHLRRLDADHARYDFWSTFNSGSWDGTRIR